MAGICGDASNARRGERVRTVTAFPFKSNAVETAVAGKPFINVVRSLVASLRINDDENCYDKLLWFIRIQIYNSDESVKDFEELCESLVSLLYFGLLYPKLLQRKNVESIFTCFLEKWFGFYDTFDIGQLILDIDEKFQISSFGTIILLYHYGNQTFIPAFDLLLKWRSPNQDAPQWMKEILSCSDSSYQNFNKILYKSLNYLDFQTDVAFSREYMNTISIFLDALKCYKLCQYEESITILNKMQNVDCGPFLRGWKEMLIGINFEYMKRLNCALVKFKEAVDQCPECCYALYYSSRVFKKLGILNAHLECLQLFSQVNSDTFNKDNSLQRVVLSIHTPLAENLSFRSKWLLASSYVINEKWTEAKDVLHSLLEKWGEMKLEQHKPSFLEPSDEIPELPHKSFVTMNYLFVLMNMKHFQQVELSGFETIFDDSVCMRFAGLQDQMKIDILSRILNFVIVAEALYRQGKYETSITKCGSICLVLESIYDPNDLWRPLILLTNVYLYKLLSSVYKKGLLNMQKNSAHFARLQDHCLHSYKECKFAFDNELMDIIFLTLNNRLKAFEIEI